MAPRASPEHSPRGDPHSPADSEWDAPAVGRRLSAPGRMSISGAPEEVRAQRARRDRRMQMRAETGPGAVSKQDAIQARIRRLIATNQICIGFARGGGKLTKYPRRSFKPIPRQYRVSADQKSLEWQDDLDSPFMEPTGFLALSGVTQLREGARTPGFERFAKSLPPDAASRCFSLIYVDETGKRERSLDLCCPSSATCSAWTQGLDALLQVEWLRRGRVSLDGVKRLASMRSIGTAPMDRATTRALRERHQALVIAAKRERLAAHSQKKTEIGSELKTVRQEKDALERRNQALESEVEELRLEIARLRSLVDAEGVVA